MKRTAPTYRLQKYLLAKLIILPKSEKNLSSLLNANPFATDSVKCVNLTKNSYISMLIIMNRGGNKEKHMPTYSQMIPLPLDHHLDNSLLSSALQVLIYDIII